MSLAVRPLTAIPGETRLPTTVKKVAVEGPKPPPPPPSSNTTKFVSSVRKSYKEDNGQGDLIRQMFARPRAALPSITEEDEKEDWPEPVVGKRSQGDAILDRYYQKTEVGPPSGSIEAAQHQLDKKIGKPIIHAGLPNKVAAKVRVETTVKCEKICRDFLQGQCTRKMCKFSHVKTGGGNAKTVPPQEEAKEAESDTTQVVAQSAPMTAPVKQKSKDAVYMELLVSVYEPREAKIFLQESTFGDYSWRTVFVVALWCLLGYGIVMALIFSQYVDDRAPHKNVMVITLEVVAFCFFVSSCVMTLRAVFRAISYVWFLGPMWEYQQSDASPGFVNTRTLWTPYNILGFSPLSRMGFKSYTVVRYDHNMVKVLEHKLGFIAPTQWTDLRCKDELRAAYPHGNRSWVEIQNASMVFQQQLLFDRKMSREVHSGPATFERL
jgi:hypothetical protein